MTQVAKFNPEALLKSLQEVNNSLPSINSDAFSQAMLEYVKIFDSMGSGLQVAFKGFILTFIDRLINLDITSKVGIINRNYSSMPQVQGGILDFIKFEQSEKIDVLNGDNPKQAPNPKYANYESSI